MLGRIRASNKTLRTVLEFVRLFSETIKHAPSPEHSFTRLSKAPGKEPPSWFPDRAPMERDAHCQSLHEFNISWSPHLRSFLQHMGKRIWSPSVEPHAEGRPTYDGVQPSSSRGLFTTLLFTTPVPCSLWHDTFHLGLGRPEPH
jgi:hypothetical protein